MNATSSTAVGEAFRANGHEDPLGNRIPVFDATDGSLSQRFAEALRGHRPVTVFLLAAALGYLLVLGATIAAGFLLTEVLLHIGGVASTDGRVVSWLASHRSPPRTEASLVGSIIAGGVVIPTLVGILVALLACIRRWRVAAFLITAITVEAATYRVTTWVVHRDRPNVVRLEHLPVNASYPSGHTAAAVAVYCGLALVLASRFHSLWVRVPCWIAAVGSPIYVATARMYRGMHHPLDSLAGLAIGVAALLVALFAARAADAAERLRSGS
jgi:membrane-associated phospholipid phosphatase